MVFPVVYHIQEPKIKNDKLRYIYFKNSEHDIYIKSPEHDLLDSLFAG